MPVHRDHMRLVWVISYRILQPSRTAVFLLTALYVYIQTPAQAALQLQIMPELGTADRKQACKTKFRHNSLVTTSSLFRVQLFTNFCPNIPLIGWTDNAAWMQIVRFNYWKGLDWSMKFTLVRKMHTKIGCEFLYYSLNLQTLFQTRSSMFNVQFNAAIPFYKWLGWMCTHNQNDNYSVIG